ncbi:MAG: hypothetical protein ACXAEU_08685 [Candidatus Hodarchaeales archaeon]
MGILFPYFSIRNNSFSYYSIVIKDCIQGSDGSSYSNDHSSNPVDPNTLNTGGMDYYAIRVVGTNGRTSYMGPIWVSYNE